MLTCPVLTVLLHCGKECKSSKQENKVKPFEFPRMPSFFLFQNKDGNWNPTFRARSVRGTAFLRITRRRRWLRVPVCLCAAVAVDGGRERKYQSVHGLNNQHYAGCCRLEEEPRNVAVATSSRTLLVIKPAYVDTCGSKWHQHDIYRLSYYSLYHYFVWLWNRISCVWSLCMIKSYQKHLWMPLG